MNQTPNKNRLSPQQVAKLLKLSPGKFTQLVAEGQLPKGRVGEDGRRFYTQQDVEFILREWKTQTTGRFLIYTLPLMLVIVFLLVLTIVEVREKIDELRISPTPTIPYGFGAPPQQYYAPDVPIPTPTPVVLSTPVYESIEKYREEMMRWNRERSDERTRPQDNTGQGTYGF
ncbi:helix-turn-helix domain-containing protein [bacterium]|nr:helix-turn-helix domain-containing protein [candidate division CSSED10-310 bacterium]